MRTILFLDITGVLRCGRCVGDSCGHLLNLGRIVTALGCDIVLTTSFRFDHGTTSTLRCRFAELGIPTWIGVTPRINGDRWKEIRAWVEDHAAARDRLVIVDDGADADLASHASDTYPECHFFQSDFDTGLDERLTRAVLALAHEA